ncbi:hypothetical protein BC829DRAFT_430209 [Chytridium lagenaria]|nr:hypothetical protein BC829DRAFT_430209 [Chytridium lagenaria]
MSDFDEVEAMRAMEEEYGRDPYDDDELEAMRAMEEEYARETEQDVTGKLLNLRQRPNPNKEIFESKPHQPQRNDAMFDHQPDQGQDMNETRSSSPAGTAADRPSHPKKAVNAKWGQGYSSSPMACTSPLFRCDQPTPIPSDWNIVNKKSSFSSMSPANLPYEGDEGRTVSGFASSSPTNPHKAPKITKSRSASSFKSLLHGNG